MVYGKTRKDANGKPPRQAFIPKRPWPRSRAAFSGEISTLDTIQSGHSIIGKNRMAVGRRTSADDIVTAAGRRSQDIAKR